MVPALRAWPAPHDPRAVIAEAAQFFRSYGVHCITADRYAGDFVVSGFQAHGITVEPSPLDRSGLYLALLPRVRSGAVLLPKDAALLRELRGLYRRRGFGGRDRVDHMPGAGSHDDRAVVVAGAIYAAVNPTPTGRMVPAVWG